MDNRHNAITATYYLEKKKREKDESGIKEVARTKWFSRLKQTEKNEQKKIDSTVPPRSRGADEKAEIVGDSSRQKT